MYQSKKMDLENYGTDEDFEYEKYCALFTGDYDAFLSMTGLADEDNPNDYFSLETKTKFQARYLLEVLNNERPMLEFEQFLQKEHELRFRKLRNRRGH